MASQSQAGTLSSWEWKTSQCMVFNFLFVTHPIILNLQMAFPNYLMCLILGLVITTNVQVFLLSWLLSLKTNVSSHLKNGTHGVLVRFVKLLLLKPFFKNPSLTFWHQFKKENNWTLYWASFVRSLDLLNTCSPHFVGSITEVNPNFQSIKSMKIEFA